MKEVKSNFSYQVGGSLDSDAPSYVTRQADSEFYKALKVGQFCYVLNSRQMGKSSLRVQTMQKLHAEGTVCVFIDLTGMGTQGVTPDFVPPNGSHHHHRYTSEKPPSRASIAPY